VLRFAYPVLQERSRVVAQARTAPVRPPAPEQLGDLVEQRLVGRGTDAATLEWDAWRRDDGRWAVRLSWRHGDSAHAAHWSLDLGRRALQTEDPAAEQLSAEEFHARTITAVTPLAAAARAAAEPRPTTRSAGSGRPDPGRGGDRDRPHGSYRDRRPGAGSDRDRPPGAGSDRDRPPGAGSDRAADRAAGRSTARGERSSGEGRRSAEARDGDAEDDGEPGEGRIAAGGGTLPLVDVEGDDDRGRRATVPSWDDILLGVRRRH
jgi:hypothetical protein